MSTRPNSDCVSSTGPCGLCRWRSPAATHNKPWCDLHHVCRWEACQDWQTNREKLPNNRRPDTAREASLRKAIFALQAKLHQQEASARDAVAVGFQHSGAKELADEWKAASDSAAAIVADYRKRAGVKP